MAGKILLYQVPSSGCDFMLPQQLKTSVVHVRTLLVYSLIVEIPLGYKSRD